MSNCQASYYRDRLRNPELLDHAVDLGFDLAVPVGGSRRGGFICCSTEAEAQRVMSVLRQHDGFPDLEYVPGGEDYSDTVCWGDPKPELPEGDSDVAWARFDIEQGRYHGYTNEVIRLYVAFKYATREYLVAALP